MYPKSYAARLAGSAMPMFVGEVREAITGVGYSWKLSGGSQLSSGATNSAKYLQLRRASVRRNTRCSDVRSGMRRRSGVLIHQAIAGASNQGTRNGAPDTREPG